MYTVLPLLIIFFILFIIIRLVVIFKGSISFYATGLDAGFSLAEIAMLWKLCAAAEIDNPASLFVTVAAIDRSIAQIKQNAHISGTEDTPKIKKLLSALYEYRTKVDLDPRKNKGIKSTKSISIGQRLHILLKGHGVFTSQVVNNGRELTIALPLKNKKVVLASTDWVKKDISVYFYRYEDASYVFDARVRGSMQFGSHVSLFLPHTDKILRTQKRSAIRCECNVKGFLFVQALEAESIDATDTPGLKCLVEDISEDGALIRIGGKGKKNLKLRLEFLLNEDVIIMHGIVRGVEYNEAMNMSRLHFQCLEIGEEEKNLILTYVYTFLTENKDGVAHPVQNGYNGAGTGSVPLAEPTKLVNASEVLEKRQAVEAMLKTSS